MPPADAVYISILRWPDAYDTHQQVAAVVEATGLDPHTAHQRVIKGVPAVVHREEASLAAEVMAPLKARRVLAIAMPERTLRAVPDPVPLKRLAAAIGAPEPMYLAEPWRAEPRGFLAADLFLLIRARLRKTIRGATQTDTYMAPTFVPGVGVTVAPVTETYRYDRSHDTDFIDLFLRDGTHFRIRGDKFNFDVLTDQRGLTDFENADKLACMLAESSPGCAVDTDFSTFNCPAMFVRHWRSRTASRSELSTDEPSFQFYAAWSFLVHKALAGKQAR